MAGVALIGYASGAPVFAPVAFVDEAAIRRDPRFAGQLAEAASLVLRAGAAEVLVVCIPFAPSPCELYASMHQAYGALGAADFEIVVPLAVQYGRYASSYYTYGSLARVQRSALSFLARRLVALEMLDPGAAVPAYHDPFVWQLIEFLVDRDARGAPAHGVIGLDLETAAYDMRVWMRTNRPDLTAVLRAQNVDFGHYLSIVVSDALYTFEGQLFSASAASSYAGLMASLPYDATLTNSRIDGVASVDPAMSDSEALRAARNGFVALTPSVRRGIVPYSAVTAAQESSPGYHLINSRLTFGIKRGLHVVLRERLCSSRLPMKTDTVIARAVAQILDPYVSSGAIRQYDHKYEIRGSVLYVVVEAWRYGEVQSLVVSVSVDI